MIAIHGWPTSGVVHRERVSTRIIRFMETSLPLSYPPSGSVMTTRPRSDWCFASPSPSSADTFASPAE